MNASLPMKRPKRAQYGSERRGFNDYLFAKDIEKYAINQEQKVKKLQAILNGVTTNLVHVLDDVEQARKVGLLKLVEAPT